MHDKGKTKAALPTNISPSKFELPATGVPGLIRRKRRKSIYILINFSSQNILIQYMSIGKKKYTYIYTIPVTCISPLLYVQGIPTNTKEDE